MTNTFQSGSQTTAAYVVTWRQYGAPDEGDTCNGCSIHASLKAAARYVLQNTKHLYALQTPDQPLNHNTPFPHDFRGDLPGKEASVLVFPVVLDANGPVASILEQTPSLRLSAKHQKADPRDQLLREVEAAAEKTLFQPLRVPFRLLGKDFV